MDEQIKSRNSTNKGFTLIEVLVVIILICLILGISSVFFANFLPKARHKAAAREMVATIKYAKNLSASRNERQTLTFNFDADEYGIKGRQAKTLPDEIKVAVYPSGVNENPVKQGQYTIVFDSTGVGDWDAISLSRGDKIIWIKADPILTAVIADEKEDVRHE